MTRISKQSESGEQIALFRFCRIYEAQIPELRWIYHIPNGGKRDAITGSRL